MSAVALALFALWGCGEPPCADGFARTAEGACLPIASGAGGDGGGNTDGGGGALDSDPGDSGDTSAPGGPQLVALPAPRLLRRASLDLRGRLPSEADLDAVEADPASLDALVAGYLEEPAFEERLVDLLGERWHTQVDELVVSYDEYAPFNTDPLYEFPWERAVGEEPLRLAARIAASDRPWRDILTADFTMTDEVLAQVWPVDYPEGEAGWREVRYTDNRPAAGVLATSGLWVRYYSTLQGLNRGRANAILRMLICEDYLARPVTFSRLESGDSSVEAIRSDPTCLGCHSSLDPLAANLFGFLPSNEQSGVELHLYHGEREQLGPTLMQTEPAWFGQPVSGLAELAQVIAADDRFETCAVDTAAAMLWRREVGVEDWDTTLALREAFQDSDQDLKALLLAVVATDEYRAGGLVEGADAALAEREPTARMASPTQLADALQDLTGGEDGFRWTYEGYDQLVNDELGYRMMAGGVNGVSLLRPYEVPNLVSATVLSRVAQAAAGYAVERELVAGEDRHLFTQVTLDDRPGDAAFEAELASLWWRLLATRPGADELAELAALWSAVEADHGPEQAWLFTVAALIRDPLFISY